VKITTQFNGQRFGKALQLSQLKSGKATLK
jgi:hypothetical protein